MKHLLFIAIGGAAGSVMRYGFSSMIYNWLGRGFPYGTLAVNVSGSLLMGLFTVLLLERLAVGPEWRAAILIGLLGAFTTFSTFSIETMNLIEQGDVIKAGLNMFLSVVTCVLAVWIGLLIGRQI